MLNATNVKDKVVLVTGATGGIGRQICITLAKHQAIPIIHYNSNIERADAILNEISDLGITSMKVKADIRKEDEVKKLIKTIREAYGRIDALVNNAGILVRGFVAMQSLSKFQNALDINLLGNFLVLKHVSAVMISQKYGSIVNVSSAAGMGGLKGQSVYSSTKGALNSLTMVAAKEMADFNIRVNAVAPGFIATGMLENATKNDLEHTEMIPMKRFGTVQDVAKCIVFLASDEANYITGQTISVDGGLFMY